MSKREMVELPEPLVRMLVECAAAYDSRIYIIEQYRELDRWLTPELCQRNRERPSQTDARVRAASPGEES